MHLHDLSPARFFEKYSYQPLFSEMSLRGFFIKRSRNTLPTMPPFSIQPPPPAPLFFDAIFFVFGCNIKKSPRQTRGSHKRGLGNPRPLCRNLRNYFTILETTPEPTVLPPSRIAKRRPSSTATGLMSETSILTLSPGMTISTPSGSLMEPVTSVVRMKN